ncbi:uncharacterized protein BJ212DRAFT_1486830 [Suillus subaureus]|uniref:Uncharacterized protein n=1 Tax=Suillus subaureus TaxID=48587 RepID=A0A9P7DVP8_9AGAM|nr:uncharacterized protein BJ212DRAFT_1486830 [Suillus subaureus]KAG1804195.1 hypothetical protein BJ212DRAFT_1486830 [Suillus subaureus]
MSSVTPPPIVLEIKSHDSKRIKVLLPHTVSLDVEDNIHMLKIGSVTEKVKVSPKCLDQIRLIIHQFCLYQQIITVLRKLPKSDGVNATVTFYMLLVKYFKDVISAFHGEVKAYASSSTSKWHSVYLNYHIALALHDSSFTEEMQITALKDIKCTWTHFREKKGLKAVQQFIGKRMHDAFCSDSNNMCGGSFEHEHSENDTISTIIKNTTTDESVQVVNSEGDVDIELMHSEETANTTKQHSAMSQSLSQVIDIDLGSGDSTVLQKTELGSRPGRLNKDGYQEKSVITQGSSKPRKDVIDVDVKSHTDEITSCFESNVYGKQKAPSPPIIIESEDDEAGSSTGYCSDPLTVELPDVNNRSSHGRDEEGLENVLLPSLHDDWEYWTRIVFEKGNSHVFLNLGTWMLIWFHQMMNLNMHALVDGLIILQNPRLMDEISNDHFFEAMGMERLYTAIAHMEMSPQYLCHLFHALGKAMSCSEVSCSNLQILPCNSPPVIEAQMLSDMDIPWLALKPDEIMAPWSGFTDVTDNDADGLLDGDEVEVIDALDCMIIGEGSTSDKPGTCVGDSKYPKRKRTSSQVSPLKKDGGRGPAKHCKNCQEILAQSLSPILSSTDIDESGFIMSPVVPHLSLISNASSLQDDESVLLEAWDANTADDHHNPDGEQQMSILSDVHHVRPIPQDGNCEEIEQPTSPLTCHIGAHPSSPVILIPDSESPKHPHFRHSPPKLSPITLLLLTGDFLHEESMQCDTDLVVGPVTDGEKDVTQTVTHATPQDTCEVSEWTCLWT